MYRHELYKIFNRKSIYVVLVFVILMMVYSNNHQDMVMKEEVYEDLYEKWGGTITDEKVNAVRDKMREAEEKAAKGPSSLTSDKMAESNVHFLVASAGLHSQTLQERKETLGKTLDSINEQSYKYKEVEKELSMLEKLGEPFGFYVIQAWRGMFDLIEPFFGVIFLSTLILIGVTPVFAQEYSTRTAGLILATKHGKKRIVTAKTMAALTYVFVVFTLLHLVNLFLQWNTHGGFKGWDAPMQNLLGGMVSNPTHAQSPFAWDIWQFYAITLTVQFLACVALAILVLFISTIVKNVMITFFISGVIIGMPFLFRQLGLEQGIFNYINTFSHLEFIRVERLFQEFNGYNVFGFPVLYPLLLLLVFAFITSTIMLLTYYRFARQKVNM